MEIVSRTGDDRTGRRTGDSSCLYVLVVSAPRTEVGQGTVPCLYVLVVSAARAAIGQATVPCLYVLVVSAARAGGRTGSALSSHPVLPVLLVYCIILRYSWEYIPSPF